ncbi:MAG TPA: SRPBCC family protein [Gemmataceae bacterium]|nr:SRPBCC family protein [Gemmataceae bacterium]
MVLQIVIIAAVVLVVVLVVLLAALLGYAATRPGSFNIQRTASIKAQPEKIYPLVSDFHNWASWSPFEKLDPAMKKTHSGAANGKGAVYEWEGNGRAGKGRMEITETSPPSKLTIKLDFIKPFEGHNIAEFTMEARNDSTNVTWAMRGPNTYMLKVMGIFFSMDSMLGKEFEAGLANMKNIAEK